MKQIFELVGAGQSIRAIAKTLGLSRNSVRKYLRSPGIPKERRRAPRVSKLEPYRPHIDRRLAQGVENCAVLWRELKAEGYPGGYTILKDYVQARRRPRAPAATMRFETEPGQQAQVDWGEFAYDTAEGKRRKVWAFVMVLSWSRECYVEFAPRADVATFIRCHLNAFHRLGGIPRQCLYDNAKVVILGRESDGRPQWNQRFLDFSLRLGFDIRLCRPYRAQTKGRVESGVKYVRGNFWPTATFSGLDDLNRLAARWCAHVANVRVHGTTRERPVDRWERERTLLQPLPEERRLEPFLREERKVGRDGYVQWSGSWYGAPWTWAGQMVQVQVRDHVVELWAGEKRVAVHPRAMRSGQRYTLPDQWKGLFQGQGKPKQEPLAVQTAAVKVERRSLGVYETLVATGGSR